MSRYLLTATAETTLLFALVLFLRIESILALLIFACVLSVAIWLLKKFRSLSEATINAFTEHRLFSTCFAIALSLLIPFVFRSSPYVIHILIMSGLAIIMSIGLNFQLGGAGLPNLGFGAFYGIGAYTSALLTTHFGISFFEGVFCGGGMAVLLGLLSGILVLRTTHAYFALVTMSLAIIFYLLVLNLEFTGGPNGVINIPPPSIGNFKFTSTLHLMSVELPMQANFFYLMLLFLLVAFFVFYRLHLSTFGLRLNALREDELASRCFSIDHVRDKLICFCVSSFFAGIAGVFYAHFVGFISPGNFSIFLSFATLSMVVLGGMNNLLGVALGAIALTLIPEKFRVFQDYRLIFYGAVIVFILLFRPKGLIPEKVRRYKL